MKKKDIFNSVDCIINQKNPDEVMFYLNDYKQELINKREQGYFYCRVRHHFGYTPKLFKDQENMLKYFHKDNFYDEILKRDSQRNHVRDADNDWL